MPDGSRGTLLARTLVGRDAQLGELRDGWRIGGAQVVTRGRRRGQEPARARAGVVGADEGRARAHRALQPDRPGHAAAAVARGAARRGARRSTPDRGPGCVRACPGACRAGVGRRRRRPVGPRAGRGGACGCCRRGLPPTRPRCSCSRTSTGPTPSRWQCSSTWSTTWPARRCSWSPRCATASPARVPTWPPS